MNMTVYPLQIDNNLTIPQAIDKITPVDEKCANNLIETVICIEKEVGALVSREFPTLKDRIDYLENLAQNCQSANGAQYPTSPLNPQDNGKLAIVNGEDWTTIDAPNDGYILSWNNTNWVTVPAPQGQAITTPTISTQKISAVQYNNFNPTNWTNADVMRFDSTGNAKISGLLPSKRKIIFNISKNKIILLGSSTSSTVNNRILIPGNTYIIQPNGSVRMYYDYTSLKWRIS